MVRTSNTYGTNLTKWTGLFLLLLFSFISNLDPSSSVLFLGDWEHFEILNFESERLPPFTASLSTPSFDPADDEGEREGY